MHKFDLRKQYNTLIEEYQTKILTKENSPDMVLERHHILPTSLGGSNETNNIVVLTAQAHFEAHRLLAEIYNNKGPMQQAFWII
ncbi:HNH endonuclease, partial [Candidatus Pacearchaeota archaeon]|nr:HNH endonuclease [Candidatus Pacearchaeota archaeon]